MFFLFTRNNLNVLADGWFQFAEQIKIRYYLAI